MSLEIILMALAGGGVAMPPTITIFRFDTGSPAEFRLGSDGVRYQRTGSVETDMGPWVYGSPASLYEVRSTVTLGSFTTDPSAGSWVSLSSSRLWDRGAAASAAQTVQATIEIRNASTLQVLSTTTLTLICDRT